MTIRLNRPTLQRGIVFVILVFVWVILSILLGQPKESNYEGGWDFQAIWLAPHLLLEGENPYDSNTWLNEHKPYQFAPQNDAFLYPLPFAVLLLSIGFFPLRIAAVLWAGITLGIIAFSFYSIIKPHAHFKPGTYIPILIGVFLFRPIAVLLYILQIDAIILLLVISAWYLWLKGKWFWGGFFIALTVLKPQIGVPMLVLLGLWQLTHSKWTSIIGEGIALVAVIVSGWVVMPPWVPQWLSIGFERAGKNFFSTPTLWGLTALICQPSMVCVQRVGTVLVVIFSGAIVWIVLRRTQEDITFVMSTVICGTLFISPNLWTYNQVLLILPLLMVTIALYRMRYPYLLVASFPLLFALVSFGLVGISLLIGADMISALLPVLVWTPLILVYRKDPALLRPGIFLEGPNG